eukprot:TRINITY_DN5062_c0_g1_i1.p1 TRINITY_DN5062_c0_g1~~TRINITY_DN5062_c0_g1_i1.p1  ORF type:complete len:305 (-),score=59.62 TRINITY_DN5062_c0_g1_i1:28-942(-)
MARVNDGESEGIISNLLSKIWLTKPESPNDDMVLSTPVSIASDPINDIEVAKVEKTKVNIKDRQYQMKCRKFKNALENDCVNINQLKHLAFNGIPQEYREISWKILLGYAPAVSARREIVIQRKRAEYWAYVQQFYYVDDEERNEYQRRLFHQINVDVPRTNPSIPIYRVVTIQNILMRILYIFAIRHPASGYVQGINDLCTPFLSVFLKSHVFDKIDDLISQYDEPEEYQDLVEDLEGRLSSIKDEKMKSIEADIYWCISSFADRIQDHYTQDLPGIHKRLHELENIIRKLDGTVFCAYLSLY